MRVLLSTLRSHVGSGFGGGPVSKMCYNGSLDARAGMRFSTQRQQSPFGRIVKTLQGTSKTYFDLTGTP